MNNLFKKWRWKRRLKKQAEDYLDDALFQMEIVSIYFNGIPQDDRLIARRKNRMHRAEKALRNYARVRRALMTQGIFISAKAKLK